MGIYFDSQRDPVDNEIADTYYWQSTSSTGSSTTYFEDLIIPASPNFPQSTAIRYMINLPGEPYYAGIVAGTHKFVVRDINTTTVLTRVAPTGTLTAHTYKIFPATAQTAGRLEVHVGTGSAQASDVLAYDGHFINSILSSTNMNDIVTDSVTSTSFLSTSIDMAGELYVDSLASTSITMAGNLTVTGGIDLGDGLLKTKVIDIGDWDMEANATKTVAHGLSTAYSHIRSIRVTIRSDNNALFLPLSGYEIGSNVTSIDSTNVEMRRLTGGNFDQAGFNQTSYNRGWIFLDYILV